MSDDWGLMTGERDCDSGEADDHPMEAALLRHVIEAPLDDGPRLVLADWLEEQGETARAEFIRVQCDLANWGDGEELRIVAQVRRSAQELLREHGPDWLPDIIGLSVRISDKVYANIKETEQEVMSEFSRGFVSSISAPLATLIGGPCQDCRGHGVTDVDSMIEEDGMRHWIPTWCEKCKRKGRIPGIGYALVRAAPICSVTVTDREPYYCEPWIDANGKEHGDFYRWWCYRQEHDAPEEHRRALLPESLYEPLRKLMPFDDDAAAQLALSRAVIDELRAGEMCKRCDGDGKAHGSDRPFEWNDSPDYMKCPACRGTGRIKPLPPFASPLLPRVLGRSTRRGG